MSRIGKLPIVIPQGVEIKINSDNLIEVKGKLGTLKQSVNPEIKLNIENGNLIVNRPSDSKEHRSMHGLYRAIINNMVTGVSTGFTAVLELIGVGYKASVTDRYLEMSLGFSHDLMIELPIEVKAEVAQEKRSFPVITLTSFDKQLLGQVVAKIRSYRMPEPYKGKGIKFQNEVLRRKEGKKASS